MIKVPVFIDYGNRITYPKGIIINRTIFAEKIKYNKNKNNIYLLGTKYFPLTKAFWYVGDKKINDNIKDIMITFGGSDPREMTIKILNYFINNHPNLNKWVVIGKGFINKTSAKFPKDKNTKLVYYPSGEEIKKIMLNSDVAISAGGQTLFELARIGTATIAVKVVENQNFNIKGLEKTGFIDFAGNWNDKKILDKIGKLLMNLKNQKNRIKKMNIGRNLIDGYGSVRIANFLLGVASSGQI
ncbi:MAG: Pseudaminic acid biosynthesis-associated protein PseG [Candidatus Roizmanbacteria bacterium GW2011_GWA2_32_13]|uniref:Pseudaminic acid biosynthesis-associated protein PseG n=1 Tax=Candidatus Roizmanbacteria bacterium GW2011_GWA2_32_13 TaxID=1618475 RepID=A0A0G0BNF6_9BACT|nr:MAG: Pseudaminic acid biosynthesis-associated protein PseG [Candidatus Roizmanbacteria bacterium GW2011_GWA2_32_13]